MLYEIHVNKSTRNIHVTSSHIQYINLLLFFLKAYQHKYKKHNTTLNIEYSEEYRLHTRKPYIPYHIVSTICMHLIKQLNWFHSLNYVLTSITKNDVLCLDNKLYMFTNNAQPMPINETEITKQDNIYDFGNLLVTCLLNESMGKKDVKEVLEPFYYTDLYWCILRCMEKDPSKRVLYYI